MRINQTPPLKVNIVIADDHPVVSLGIKKIIEEFKHLYLIAAATTISGLFELLNEVHCDVLICDFSFEGDKEPDGLILLERLQRLYPKIKIILLTVHDDLVLVQRVMSSGAMGFVSKASTDLSILPKVIDIVLRGGQYIDQKTSSKIFHYMVDNNLTTRNILKIELSPREREVLRLFSRGMSITDIAQLTGRSIKTISTQKTNAMIKLGVKNDVDLVRVFNKCT